MGPLGDDGDGSHEEQDEGMQAVSSDGSDDNKLHTAASLSTLTNPELGIDDMHNTMGGANMGGDEDDDALIDAAKKAGEAVTNAGKTIFSDIMSFTGDVLQSDKGDIEELGEGEVIVLKSDLDELEGKVESLEVENASLKKIIREMQTSVASSGGRYHCHYHCVC